MAAVFTLTGLGLAARLVRRVEGASIKARRGRVLTHSDANSYRPDDEERVSVDPTDRLVRGWRPGMTEGRSAEVNRPQQTS